MGSCVHHRSARHLPDNTPILEVFTQPKTGWTATLTKENQSTPQKDDKGNLVTQYVSQVHWKANCQESNSAQKAW